ncbi:Zinc finger, SWIM-type [Sesbania bispinosa]|nr:Zinc finger, SWIM-type [Sesbania bispinosa]
MENNVQHCNDMGTTEDSFDDDAYTSMNDVEPPIDFAVNSEADFANFDPAMLNEESLLKFHFVDLEVAYEFYNWYANIKGFSVRKSKVRKQKNDEIVEKNFLCHREGGYEHVGFRKRDTYNEIGRQRLLQCSDAKGVVKYLRDSNDPAMFWRHTVDGDGRLQRLFWCDGRSQVDYNLFGEVVAFDATYRKNKYHFPLVVFSEETYVWILEQLLVAMKGLSTTSRCEGLHAQLARFVHSRHDLVGFLQNFDRCLESLRCNEIEADFATVVGEQVLQTNLHRLERSASRIFTREVFLLVHPAIARGSTMRVTGCTQTMSQTIYTVSKYARPNNRWHISYNENPLCFKCSCQRMECWVLPCDHLIGLLVHLDIEEIPKYLINDKRNCIWESVFLARCGALDFLCRKMNKLAGKSSARFQRIRDIIKHETDLMIAEDEAEKEVPCRNDEMPSDNLRDPVRVGAKGCAASSSSQVTKRRQKM